MRMITPTLASQLYLAYGFFPAALGATSIAVALSLFTSIPRAPEKADPHATEVKRAKRA